jgi:hypothetical protein
MKAFVSLALLMACLSVAVAETMVERVDFTFTMEEGDVVRLAGSQGTVKVTRAPARELVVEAVKRVEAQGSDQARQMLQEIEVTASQEPGRVVVGFQGPESTALKALGWPWKSQSWGVDCHLQVPVGCPVELVLTSGDVDAEDLVGSFVVTCTSGDIHVDRVSSGSVEIETTSGDVDVAGVEGTVTIRATSGDVSVEGISGTVSIRTVSGDVSAVRVESEADIESVSGDILIENVLAKCPSVRGGSTSGDVSLTLSKEASAVLSIATESGDVSFGSLPLRATDARETRWQGTVGDGCGSVEIRTVGGDVLIERTGAGSDGM